ncbi:MAG: hypothetical protein ITG02_04460 [Patulibacter sp.]|nr:hypothetical protein [Patulibacter sp.]
MNGKDAVADVFATAHRLSALMAALVVPDARGLACNGLLGLVAHAAEQRSNRDAHGSKQGAPVPQLPSIAGCNQGEVQMFGSIKKAMVAGAVVATAALAGPAMASATQVWSPPGSHTATGSLSMTVDANGITTVCDTVTAGITLDATGPLGTVDSLDLEDCYVSTPGFGACTVSATATGLPWEVEALSATGVTISTPSFQNTYGGGAGCPLNGLTAAVSGSSITADYDNGLNTLSFDNAPGMSSSTLGPVSINGSLTIPGVTITL